MSLASYLISVFIITVSVNGQANQIKFCGDFKPQVIVDVDKLMKTWYGIEIIFHGETQTEGIKHHKICPAIYLSSPTNSWSASDTSSNWRIRPTNNDWNHEHTWDDLMKPIVKIWKEDGDNESENKKKKASSEENYLHQMKLQKLKLIWSENGKKVEYSLQYNASKPGEWMSFQHQNGSMVDQTEYVQFIGTIQVLRAVYSHVILTFCHINNESQFYTLVMSREQHMTERQLQDIHNFLQRKHFAIKHIKRMCFVQNNVSSVNRSCFNLLFILVIHIILLNIMSIYS